ncbi:MAG TPA: pyridoxamine 5'-phosphate oxidase family protein [Stellaceae bacterium]|nr:pyridoxamine 5'-phosphate oxidase family protein [Stellaceae bacterium]
MAADQSEAADQGGPADRGEAALPRRRQIRMTAEEQAAFLRDNSKCALATIDQDGFPHVVAMGFYVEDGVFYMTSYAKAQKVLNIRRNPKVGLMVETGGRYAELRGVMVRGTCEIIDDVEVVRQVVNHRRSAAESGRRGALDSAPKRVVLKITPRKTTSWDHGKLGGRY